MFILCLFGFGWLFGFCVYKFPLFVYLFILLLFFCSCFYLLEGEPKPSVMFYSFFFHFRFLCQMACEIPCFLEIQGPVFI